MGHVFEHGSPAYVTVTGGGFDEGCISMGVGFENS